MRNFLLVPSRFWQAGAIWLLSPEAPPSGPHQAGQSVMSTSSPFIVNALELATTPQDFDVHEPAEALHLSREDMAFNEPVSGNLSWRWIDGRAVLTGVLATRAQGACVRCLGKAQVQVVGQVNVIFTDEPLAESDLFDLDDEDDTGLVHYHGDRIDARDELRDILLLETPELPVCGPDCKGLCPQCGADLNAEPCACVPPDDSPPAFTDSRTTSPSWRAELNKLRDALK